MSDLNEPVIEPERETKPEAKPEKRQSEPSGEQTAPFLLERSSSDLERAAEEAKAMLAHDAEERVAHDAEENDAARAPRQGTTVDTGTDVLRSARRLGVIVLLNALLYLAIAGAGALRYSRDRTAIPEVVLAIIALGLAIWGSLSGYHLLRASRAKADAGHQLSGAFSNFRSIFILKGTGLFLVLALSCFAFSAVLSLAALL